MLERSDERRVPLAVAVAPALNESGSADFDPNRLAELMAAELGEVAGIDVIPVSRVLAVLLEEGGHQVESPEQLRRILDRLGVDRILVFAVTEYEPYDPPIVGIAAQLFGPSRRDTLVGSPTSSGSNDDSGEGLQALAEYRRVFNAAHDRVIDAVKEYARSRDSDESPYGWRKYVASQTDYLRFCCHETVRGLTSPRRFATAGPRSGLGDE